MQVEQHIVQTLKAEFDSRCARNQRYSLRAFGKSIGVSHSLLSMVLSGKRAPSKSLLIKASALLDDRFKIAMDNGTRYEMQDETFEAIASWIHFAILGLLSLQSFQESPNWIAKKLNTSPMRVRIAWETLRRHNLIGKVKGRWQQLTPPITANQSSSIKGAISYNREILEKAKESMDVSQFSERDITSIVFPMNAKNIALAKEKIRIFRRSLCADLEKHGEADRVYTLAIQLFPLSNP